MGRTRREIADLVHSRWLRILSATCGGTPRYRDVTDFDPTAVVIDPMSALLSAGATGDMYSMVLRLVDFLKIRDVTALFTDLGAVSGENATTKGQISSLMDVWLLLYNRESNGEHNRQLYLLKSRGMAHSNQ
jgi:circadian clock protein KaiC